MTTVKRIDNEKDEKRFLCLGKDSGKVETVRRSNHEVLRAGTTTTTNIAHFTRTVRKGTEGTSNVMREGTRGNYRL